MGRFTPYTFPANVPLTCPNFYGYYTIAQLGSELAPAIATWTGNDGATWSSPNWTIPNGGSISANVAVTSGGIYQVAITLTTATVTVGRMTVTLGTVSSTQYSGDDANWTTTLVANATGTVTLNIGYALGNWAATLQNVSVKKISGNQSAVARMGTTGTWYERSNGTGSMASGDGHKYRLGDYNLAVGYQAQLSLTTGKGNNAFGRGSQYSLTNGIYNNAFGYYTQRYLTTGVYNNAFGYSAQEALTIGCWNTAIGNESQVSLTTGNNNIAIGRRSQDLLTTGEGNVGLGSRVQFAQGEDVTNALTTASYQTCIGFEVGQSSATQADYLTALGASSKGTTGATAIGAGASAGGVGSVAIGRDSAGNAATTTTQDDFILGTALHKVKIPGVLNMTGIATADPHVAGQIWSNSGVLTVSAG